MGNRVSCALSATAIIAFAVAPAAVRGQSFAYSANASDNSVSLYVLNASTGALIQFGAPIAAGTNPTSVTVDRLGRFAYVANALSNNVSAYTINPSTGSLTPAAGSPFAAGAGPETVTVEPFGKFAFVGNAGDNTISAYSINAGTGALTPVTGSPFAAGVFPDSVTVDPLGRFLYAANVGDNTVSAYTINPVTGALTPVPGPSFPAGNAPVSLTVEPSGRFLYVSNAGGNTISGYIINPGTGGLVPVPGSPFAAGAFPNSVIVDPSGQFLYAANASDNNVSAYTINPGTGALTPVAGSPVAAGTHPSSATVDASGKFVYAANTSSNSISAYTINSSTGALTAIAGSPFPAGSGPVSIVTAAIPSQPPSVIGVINAASLMNSLSPGVLATVIGSNLDGTGLIATLNGEACAVSFASSGQLNLQFPFDAPVGFPIPFVVSTSGGTAAAVMVTLNTFAPGFFSLGNPSANLGVFVAVGGPLITVSAPANPGQLLNTFLVGLGQTNPPAQLGSATGATTTTPTLTVGGLPANVLSSGLSAPGVYQVTFVVPPGIASGNQPVTLNIGGFNSQTVTLPIALRSQNITFGALLNQPFGTAPFLVGATASSGLAVGFAAITPACMVTGQTVTLLAVGICTIQATQTGNSNYAAAQPVNQSFQVLKGNQFITFGALANQPVTAAPFVVSATASSNLPVTFNSLTMPVCMVSGSIVTLVSPGTCTIQAMQVGDANYATAVPVNQSFQVLPTIQLPAGVTVSLGAFTSFPVTLATPAPPGGVFITLTSSDPSKVTLNTSAVLIPAGATVGTVTPKVNGIAFGSSNISASAPGFQAAIQAVQTVDTLTFSPATLTVPGGTIGHVFLVLSASAPPGGLVINLSSSAPSVATVPATVTVPSNSNIASVAITGVATGPATIHASNLPFVADITANITVISGTPASVTATSGTPQIGPINTAFAPLIATVKDGGNNPISGVTVTFTAPGSGPSGTFAGGNTAVTDSFGMATVIFTANALAGPYKVTASVPGVAQPASFSLTNIIAFPTITATSGSGQSKPINTAFSSPLVATVKDASGNPMGGVIVTFSAPLSGPSGTFASLVNTALTNPSGVATSTTFTANSVAGNYSVIASAPSVPVPAAFPLTNLAGSPFSITATGGTPQTAGLSTPYVSPLIALVTDSGGNPVPNVVVTFTSPAAGASGMFAGGVNTAMTNSSGIATSAAFTANGTVGPYLVTATSGSATSATFALTNVMGLQIPSGVIVGLGSTTQFPVTLGAPAPPGGLFVTLTSSDPTKVGLNTSNVLIPGGQTTSSTIPQLTGVAFGSATITASAVGYPSASQMVTTTDTLSFSPSVASINPGSTGIIYLVLSVPAPPGGLTINLSSSDSQVATVPSTVTIPGNSSSIGIIVTGVSTGSVAIHASQLPNIADVTANVTIGQPGRS